MMRILAIVGLLHAVQGDVYLQYPPGSNNRLDEGGGNRNNNNRLMDTQNNAKGGYGYGGAANNPAAALKYMAGSKLSMTWTSQHSCGSENAECQIVIQYMCNDDSTPAPGGPFGAAGSANAGTGEGPLRDGVDNDTPNPNNPDALRGLHEPTSFYQACKARERNKGLYTADQNLGNANDATRTRQNPNGARSGLECPEERDYYPYWAPTPWKDLMIMTNNLAMCDTYKAESQNVRPRGVCTGSDAARVPNNAIGCEANSGTWEAVPAFGIAPPLCVAAPVQRDNHLGNDRTGNEVVANFSIPFGAGAGGVDDVSNCVLRLRYNITTADTRACSLGKTAANQAPYTQASCEGALGIWSAFYIDSTYNEDVQGNADDPDTLLSPPAQNPKTNMGGLLDGTGGTNSLLELAINTNQYGRTFQDRSHKFSIQSRPAAISDNANIYNLNVKGKRGNIVQTYPATEYDFHPVDLVVGQSDLVHIQWTGNDNTNNNGNNNGEGTNDEDRHNIVQIDNSGMDVPMTANQASMFDVAFEWNPEPTTNTAFGGARDQTALTKQFALSKQVGCAATGDINSDQQRNNCEKLNSAAATVDLGLLRFKQGVYKYMSSRNNNFSNRAQKAKITTLASSTTIPPPPVNVTVTNLPGSSPESASVRVTWSPPGSATPYTGSDGREYVVDPSTNRGYAQEDQLPIAYTVQYSYDGGDTWNPTSCVGSENSCVVKDLPAGTPTAFIVRSGSSGGWSTPSPVAVQLTTGERCRGSPGATAAIVIGVLAAVFTALGVAWYFKFGGRDFMASKFSSPPPPPPYGRPTDLNQHGADHKFPGA